MAIKKTPLSVQNELTAKLDGFHDRAKAVKDAYYPKHDAIRQDSRLSDTARADDLDALSKATRTALDDIRGEQEAYISNLKSSIEAELRGNQPKDANSVLLRRDASDRARKLETERDALAALNDAVRDGDESMAHAIGTRGRNNGWVDVADAWKAAYPETSGTAEALAYVEANTSGAAFNLANSMAYSDPAA